MTRRDEAVNRAGASLRIAEGDLMNATACAFDDREIDLASELRVLAAEARVLEARVIQAVARAEAERERRATSQRRG